jgi:PGAP1-like protein
VTATGQPTLVVHGGAGGTAARLEDLDAAGTRLGAAARTMTWVAARAAQLAVDPAPALTLFRSPLTWREAERCLARALLGRSGAVVVAARYTAVASGALAAVAVYREADAAADAAVQAADVAAGEAVGRLMTVPAIAAATAVVPAVLARPSAVVVAGDVLLDTLAEHADGVEHVVDAAPGALRGALLGSPLLAVLAAGVTGRATVPLDVPGAAGWIGSVGRAGPWLRESLKVTVRPGPATAVAPPQGLAGLLAGVAALDPDEGVSPGSVRVIAVTRPGGCRAWVVQIPGTQSWSPKPGGDPLDLTGNVHALAGEPTASQRLVAGALRAAGVPSGEPVLLVGHSQGGMVAANLAADPEFRKDFHVTHVVTAGSPVATVPVPESVSVLSLEHDHDLVPRLDGAANPDRAGWITVSTAAEAPGESADAVRSHDLGSYARTAAAVDASADPGLVAWRAGLAPFLAGDGVTATQLLVTGQRQAPA